MKSPRSSHASRSRSRSPGACAAGGAGGAREAHDAFRVRVHMARYFGDERARAYVSVRGERRVRWLRRRLRALFALPRSFALLSRGHLLPPDEPLALLRPDDVVDVVPSRVEPGEPAPARAAPSAPGSAADDSDAEDGDLLDRCFSAAEPEVLAQAPAELAPEFNGEDDLSEHKRRALTMLDQYCGRDQFEEDAQRALRPRRRRVRRRRRSPPAAAVLRNGAGAGGARAPRLVRPLGAREAAAASSV